MSGFIGYLRGDGAAGMVPTPLSNASLELLRDALGESRALSVSMPGGGGFLAPEAFEAQVFETLDARSSAWALLSRLESAAGGELVIVTANDTTNQGSIQTEGSTRAEGDLAVGRVISRPYVFSSGLIRLSLELANDAPTAEAMVATLLGDRLRRGLDRVAWVGTGPAQPRGLTTAATNLVTGASGTATSIPWSNIRDLVDAVAAPYKHAPDGTPLGRWLMSDTTWRHVSAQVDGSGAERGAVDLDIEKGPHLLGFKVTVDDNMPALGAGNRTVLFGDFQRAGVLRVVQGIRLGRLVEVYATSGQIALLAELRADVIVTDAAAYAAFEHGAA